MDGSQTKGAHKQWPDLAKSSDSQEIQILRHGCYHIRESMGT